MKPVEIILIVKTETENKYYSIPIENYEKVKLLSKL